MIFILHKNGDVFYSKAEAIDRKVIVTGKKKIET